MRAFIQKMKKHKLTQAITFVIIVSLLLAGVSYICIPTAQIKQQNTLYENEIEDSVDVAFIGSSATYRFYDVMTVWEEYGITSMCYYIASMPYDFIIPMIELVQENQDPEVYVIDLRHIITDEFKMQYYGGYETDTQKAAYVNALNLLTNAMVKWDAIVGSDYTEHEYYLYLESLLYNHDGFIDGIGGMIEETFIVEEMAYKGNYMSYSVQNLTEEYVDFDTIEEEEDYTLTEDTETRLTELLEYCDENEIDAYFTITPYVHQKGSSDEDIRREFEELVTEYGYPFADYRDEIEEIGLDVSTDFYDETHANALGAEKYTIYAMEDILEVYEVEPDYEEEVVESWDEEYEDWVVYEEEMLEELYEEIEELEETNTEGIELEE